MTKVGFQYEDMYFTRKIKNDKDVVIFSFLKFYYFEILTDTLREIAEFEIEDDGSTIFFDCNEKHMINKMNRILEDGFNNLYNKINGKRVIYITEESSIPLIGSNEFGLIDRGTNIIETGPLTGCNLNCIYCSVDEGINNKLYDYIIDHEYLINEINKVSKIKVHEVEVNIGPHGEPLLYPKIVEFIRGLKENPKIKIVSINTNGIILNKQLIDELADAGLTRINLSINSLDQELATKLAGKPYPLKHILRMIDYGKDKINFLLAPIIVPGFNDEQIKPLLELSKTIKSDFPTIGFQNFLSYNKGRNPTKQRSWEEFYELLKKENEDLNVKIDFTNQDFKIFEDKALTRPMKKNQTIDVEIVMPGRYPKEYIAKAFDRVITISQVERELKIGQKVRVKIYREKHNIYKAQLLR